MMTIHAKPISLLNFSNYGELISIADWEGMACNQGRAIRYNDIVKTIDCEDEFGRIGVSIYSCQASRLPFEIQVMERHPLGSQFFMPLSEHGSYLIAVCAEQSVEPDHVEAFIVPAEFGINYHKGVWHLPIVALNQSMRFLTIDRIGSGENCEEVSFQGLIVCDK